MLVTYVVFTWDEWNRRTRRQRPTNMATSVAQNPSPKGPPNAVTMRATGQQRDQQKSPDTNKGDQDYCYPTRTYQQKGWHPTADHHPRTSPDIYRHQGKKTDLIKFETSAHWPPPPLQKQVWITESSYRTDIKKIQITATPQEYRHLLE